MGVDTDLAIAQRLGVTAERVRQVREQWGIPSRRDFIVINVEYTVMDTIKFVPLTAEHLEQLIERRIEKNLSQLELANLMGVTQTMISYLERGKRAPSTGCFKRWMQALGKKFTIDVKVEIK